MMSHRILCAVLKVHEHHAAALEQPVVVLRHPEDVELALLLVPVAAYALEYGGAVVQSVSHNAYLSVFDGNYLSTEEGKRLRHLETLPVPRVTDDNPCPRICMLGRRTL